MAIRPLTVLFLLVLLGACQAPEPDCAFYYWRSTFSLSEETEALLAAQGTTRLYIKYFDVDVEGGVARPVAPIRFLEPVPERYEVTPCVFITNRTFQAKGVSPEKLASRVWDYLQQINASQGRQPTTYQFDCDWTPSTRAGYFAFLAAIRQRSGPATLSATIRLHQYRAPEQTGVPPVDEGTLMYYNMGDIEDVGETNSILDNEKGSAYLTNRAYPLPLDVALPVFSWGLLYRLGELHTILPRATEEGMDTLPLLEKQAAGRYRVQQNGYFSGQYINRGDQLRWETATEADLQAAVDLLATINHKTGTLLFYDLNEDLHQRYPLDMYRRLADRIFR